MNNNSAPLKVVVAESAVIIRSGLTAVLKRMANPSVHPVEVATVESLQNYVRLHAPDIINMANTVNARTAELALEFLLGYGRLRRCLLDRSGFSTVDSRFEKVPA